MRLTHTTEIAAPIDLVWRVYTDVERWPQWMESMDHVDVLRDGRGGDVIEGAPLAHGARVWISQPRLPNATWEVTEFSPGRGWTWVSRSPGATSTATHALTPIDAATTRVDMALEMRGALGRAAGRLLAKRAERYLAMEAAGLQAACEAHAAS